MYGVAISNYTHCLEPQVVLLWFGFFCLFQIQQKPVLYMLYVITLYTICINFQFTDLTNFDKIYCSFLHKSIKEQTWLCREESQGQPRTIICINFVRPVPNTVYQVSRSFAFWLRKGFDKIWAWRPSLSCTLVIMTVCINFRSPNSVEALYERLWYA